MFWLNLLQNLGPGSEMGEFDMGLPFSFVWWASEMWLMNALLLGGINRAMRIGMNKKHAQLNIDSWNKNVWWIITFIVYQE